MAAIPFEAPFWVGEQLVRLLDRQEALLVAAGAIGMKALREAAMRGLDLIEIGAAQHPKDAIGIVARLQARHRGSAAPSGQLGQRSELEAWHGRRSFAPVRGQDDGPMEWRQRTQITLVEESCAVPAEVRFGADALVQFRAGQSVRWRLM